MSSEKSRAEEARRQARHFFAKDKNKESTLLKEKQKSEAALDEKTARLRALRLAKEEADRNAVPATASINPGKLASR